MTATFTASVWEVLVKPGDEVEEGQNLVILEVTADHNVNTQSSEVLTDRNEHA